MKRWFSLALLIAALLGLVGQEAAFARAMPSAQAGQAAVVADAAQTDVDQMSPDCAEMMRLAPQPPKSDTPCQGMTPDCVAKMGCAVPVAVIPPLLGATPTRFRLLAPRQMTVARLVGREISPEIHPPADLG